MLRLEPQLHVIIGVCELQRFEYYNYSIILSDTVKVHLQYSHVQNAVITQFSLANLFIQKV